MIPLPPAVGTMDAAGMSLAKEMMISKEKNGVIFRSVIPKDDILLCWAEKVCQKREMGQSETRREEFFYYEGFQALENESFLAQLERELKRDFEQWTLPDFSPAPIKQLLQAIERMISVYEAALGRDERLRWKVKIDVNQMEGEN